MEYYIDSIIMTASNKIKNQCSLTTAEIYMNSIFNMILGNL